MQLNEENDNGRIKIKHTCRKWIHKCFNFFILVLSVKDHKDFANKI